MKAIVYWCTYLLVYALSLLPMRVLYGVGYLIYLLSYYGTGYRKNVVIQNIARAFPEKQYDEVRVVTRRFYRCFAAYLAEMVKSLSASPKRLERNVVVDNTALIATYLNQGRHVIACSGHCANWEVLNVLPRKLPGDIYAVYKPLKSRFANQLMIKIRSRFGLKLVSDASVIRHVRTPGGRPRLYLFLSDQSPRQKDEQYNYAFLHQATYFFSGMERLARRTDSGVVYLNITRRAKGKYTVVAKPICQSASHTEPGQITQEYARLLAGNINEQPHGWLWTHRRWK